MTAVEQLYPWVLIAHSWGRWVLLALFALVIVRAVSARYFGLRWTRRDSGFARILAVVFDVELTLGLILYFALSPLLKTAMNDMGAAMANKELRFFAVEHLVGMLIAAALIHIGVARMKKLELDSARPMTLIRWLSPALIVVLLSIPWWRLGA